MQRVRSPSASITAERGGLGHPGADATGVGAAVPDGAALRLRLAGAAAASLLLCAGGCATDSPGAPVAAPAHPAFSDMFARTLAAVLAVPGPGLAASVALGLTGSIVSWFGARSMHGGATVPSAGGAATAGSSYPVSASGQSMGYASAASASTPYVGGSSPYNAPAPLAAAYPGSGSDAQSSLYAGVAFEVHAQGRDGSDSIVDPATHSFATGDRFRVYYRPSLPGIVDIYNVNPVGQVTHIDRATIAAGQLVTLGPYEFTATTGDEALRLTLSPCTSQTLTAATRSIVHPGAIAQAGAPGALALPACDAPAQRGLLPATRDITKVGTEGTTNYALDPLASQELSSGQFASRTLTISFHHR